MALRLKAGLEFAKDKTFDINNNVENFKNELL